jgi:hypothetical protein
VSSQLHDLEAALRNRYASLDPGAAPLALRRVVERIPLSHPGLERPRQRSWSLYLGLAAALAILAVALSGLRGLPFDVSPGASIAPNVTFDPTLEGPGIVTAPPPGGHGLLVAIAVLVFGLVAVAVRGWRRIVPLGLAAIALAYGVVAAFIPIEVSTHGFGPGIAVSRAEMPPGSSEDLLYVTAGRGEPFSFVIFLSEPTGPFPVTIEGLVEPPGHFGPRIVAVWNDELPMGGTAPGRPFVPSVVSNGELTLWLVGKADSCALGSPPPGDVGMTGLAPLKVRVSVLGWPREVELHGVPIVFQPDEDRCIPTIDP